MKFKRMKTAGSESPENSDQGFENDLESRN